MDNKVSGTAIALFLVPIYLIKVNPRLNICTQRYKGHATLHVTVITGQFLLQTWSLDTDLSFLLSPQTAIMSTNFCYDYK